MGNQGRPIWFSAMLDNTSLRAGIVEQGRLWQKSEGYVKNAASSYDKVWKTATTAVAGYLSVQGVSQFVSKMVQVRGEFQQLEIAFGTMLKSGDRAKKLMSDLSEFAATTPFGLQSSASAAKQLLAYGSSVETLIDEMRMLGDVAAGTSQPIGDLVYLYGTLRTQGRAYMMDIRQFAGRGIPIYDELAKVLGTTKDRVNEFVSAGKVGFAEVEQAFKNMTSSGGMYGGLMEAQSKSVTGRIEQLKDAIDIMFNEIGKASEGAIYSSISGVASLVENYEKVGKILISLVATYGAYRAALIFATAATKGWTAAELIHYNVLVIVEKAQKLLNKTMLANPYVLLATLAVGLVATMWALRDSTTAAERAQERLNKRQEEFAQKEQERRARIDELIRTIQDETQTTYAQIAAYEELQRLSPALTNAYSREQLAVLELAEANKTLNFEQDNRNYDKLISDIGNTTKSLENLRKQRENILKKPILTQSDSAWLSQLAREESVLKNELAQYRKNLDEHNRLVAEAEFNALPPAEKIKIKEEQLAKIRSEFDKVNSIINEEMAKLPQEVQIPLRVEVTDGEQQSQGWQGYSPQLNLAQARADALRSEEQALQAEVDAMEASTDTKKELTEEEKKRLADEARRRREQAQKENDALVKLEAQFDDDVAQARIDDMTDGLAKTLAQNAENHRRELRQIEEQKRELLAARQATLPKGQTATLTPGEVSGFSDMTVAADTERMRANKAARDAVLADMMTFSQKYEKIITDTNAKIKEAQVAGAGWGNFEVLQGQEKEQIDQLAVEYAQKSADYKTFMESIVDASIEEINAQIDAANAIILQLVDGGIDSGEVEKLLEYRARLIGMQEQLENDKPDTSPDKDSEKDWKKLYSTLQKVEKEFNEIGDAIGGVAGEAIKTAGSIASNVMQVVDGIANLVKVSATAMTTTSKTASTAIQAVEKASVILAIIGAVMKIIGALKGIFDANAEATRAATAANNEYLRSLREIEFDRALDRRSNVFGTDNLNKFLDAVELAKQSASDLQKNVALTEFGGWNRVEGIGNLKELKVELSNAMDGLDGIEADFRSKWQRMWGMDKNIHKFNIDDFWDGETLDTQKLQSWYDANKEGLDDTEKDIINNLLASGKEFDAAMEIQTAYIEQLWGDLASSIADNMIEAFLETGNAAENLGEIVDDVARNMAKSIIESLLISGDKERGIKAIFGDDFQDDLMDYVSAGDMEQANSLMQDAVKEAEELAPIIEGILTTLGLTADAASREATAKGISTASQDSVDELNGRMTVIQGHTFSINENTKLLLANSNRALQHLANIDANTFVLHAMRLDMQSMRSTLSDISTRGVSIREQ
jgi:tape measure domain-containing protein